MEPLLLSALAIVGFIFIVFRHLKNKNNRKGFNDLIDAIEARNAANKSTERTTPSSVTNSDMKAEYPDMNYAGKAFAQVALMRANDIDFDLHEAEQRLAEAELDKGCTVHQALSMRWGGVQAIHADLFMFSDGVEVAKSANRPEPFLDSAKSYLAIIIDQCPTEFSSFKQYLGAA